MREKTNESVSKPIPTNLRIIQPRIHFLFAGLSATKCLSLRKCKSALVFPCVLYNPHWLVRIEVFLTFSLMFLQNLLVILDSKTLPCRHLCVSVLYFRC